MGAKCKVCGRPLRSAVSIALGVGPVCRGKSKRGRRHKGPGVAGGGGGHYDNGANGGGNMPPPLPPMSDEEALATIRRVAGMDDG